MKMVTQERYANQNIKFMSPKGQEVVPFVHPFNLNHKFDRDVINNFAKESKSD